VGLLNNTILLEKKRAHVGVICCTQGQVQGQLRGLFHGRLRLVRMQLTIAQGDREPPFKRRPAETAPWREEARLPFSREPCWKGVVYGADAAEVKGGGYGFAGDRETRRRDGCGADGCCGADVSCATCSCLAYRMDRGSPEKPI
jgi:hypothetical protein